MSKLWWGLVGETTLELGWGGQAQENRSAASNLPAWGFKEIADLSMSRAPLRWSCGGGWLEWAAIMGGGGIF